MVKLVQLPVLQKYVCQVKLGHACMNCSTPDNLLMHNKEASKAMKSCAVRLLLHNMAFNTIPWCTETPSSLSSITNPKNLQAVILWTAGSWQRTGSVNNAAHCLPRMHEPQVLRICA